MRGDAHTVPVTHLIQDSVIGDVLLMKMGPLGHAAEIVGFEGSMYYHGFLAPEYIVVWTANWPIKCGATVTKVRFDDSRIRGVYRPVIHMPQSYPIPNVTTGI